MRSSRGDAGHRLRPGDAGGSRPPSRCRGTTPVRRRSNRRALPIPRRQACHPRRRLLIRPATSSATAEQLRRRDSAKSRGVGATQLRDIRLDLDGDPGEGVGRGGRGSSYGVIMPGRRPSAARVRLPSWCVLTGTRVRAGDGDGEKAASIAAARKPRRPHRRGALGAHAHHPRRARHGGGSSQPVDRPAGDRSGPVRFDLRRSCSPGSAVRHPGFVVAVLVPGPVSCPSPPPFLCPRRRVGRTLERYRGRSDPCAAGSPSRAFR